MSRHLDTDDGRGDLVLSAVAAGVAPVSRVHRDKFIPDMRDNVADVLREARRNGHRTVTVAPGKSWTVHFTDPETTVYVEIHT